MKTGKNGISDIISVFNMYEQKMYHIAYAILHDSYQAEDAVMDAFVRLLEQQYTISDPAANATKRLIIQVTRSAAIDLYRKNSRESERQTLVDAPSAMQSAKERSGGCGEAQTEIMLLFNRLIDPSKIDCVEVNGLIYNVGE